MVLDGLPGDDEHLGDGVSDDIDRCPERAGPKENFGCPWPDRDGDTVADKDDRCPDEPGPVENHGCPQKSVLIVVRRDRIELKQQIHFQPNRAIILSDSYDVLRQLGQAVKDAEGEGGYARPLTEEENEKLRQELGEAAKRQDVIITTAQIPGRPDARSVTNSG